MIEKVVKDFLGRVFPGGILVIFKKSGVVSVETFGKLEEGGEEVDEGTLYDLASLTKVIVTAPLTLKALERGELSLQSRVKDFIGELEGDWKGDIRIVDLLTHTSGLPAYFDLTSSEDPWGDVLKLEKAYEPGKRVVYSCMGYIILGKILERIWGRRLDEIARREIFDPLEMERTSYNPPKGLKIAPTTSRGIVHDPNARALGGVSGNAGLFSTALDVAKFMISYINGEILHPSIVELATRDLTPNLNESRGLGWKVKRRMSEVFPEIASERTFGHTGYTGTLVWYDPEIDCGVVLLTNRVNVSDIPESRRLMNEFRRRVGNVVVISCS